jgi:cystathionine beta-lyase
VSPSKAFNIAGLQIANIIVQNDSMRQAVDRAININEVCDVNPFGVIALQAAYTSEGEEWLTQLNEYIYGNYRFVCEYIAEHLPALHPVRLEGTYLLWIDVSATGMTGTEYTQMLMEKAKVCVNDGAMYGAEAGRDFIRVNLATQRARLHEALQRIAAVCL